MFASRRAACALLLSLAAACTQVDYLDIEPSSVVFKNPNESVWLSAKAMSHTGTHHAQEKVVWSVKDESIARVDAAGKITPVKSGRTEVTATHRQKVSASVPVEVLYAAKLQVEPARVELRVGAEAQELKVRVWDYQGRELSDRTPTFKSLAPKVVSMGQNAAFPLAPGDGRVEVRVGELVQHVDVKVAPEK